MILLQLVYKPLIIRASQEQIYAGRIYQTMARHKCKFSIGCTNCESLSEGFCLPLCVYLYFAFPFLTHEMEQFDM